MLDLKSDFFHYQVLCATPPTPAHGEAYLSYADRIVRLNYVLNPGKTLPEQRIKLDAALRQAGYIPVEVTFGDPNTVQVRARNRIYWGLSDRDRQLIGDWDGLLAQRRTQKSELPGLPAVAHGERRQASVTGNIERRHPDVLNAGRNSGVVFALRRRFHERLLAELAARERAR